MKIERTPNWRILLHTWPKSAAVLIVASFGLTVWRLYLGILGRTEGPPASWLEPLASILGGFGAFLLAATLVFRRVESAKGKADTFSLARGLATGYYFNFVQPVFTAMGDASRTLHTQIEGMGAARLAGVVVGIPQSDEDANPDVHPARYDALMAGADGGFEVHKLDIQVAGRPRPVFAKLAVSRKNKAAFILDIPTTLTVIPRFAKFLVEHSADAAVADDEHVTEARKKLVVSSETVEFKEKLEEFVRVVYAHGAQEPRETSPIPLLHMVPLTHWRQRMEELAGH